MKESKERITSLVITVLFGCMILISCSKEQPVDPLSETRLLFGTYCTITVYGIDDYELIDKAFEMCEQYEFMFNMNVEGGELWRVNNAAGKPVAIDTQTIEVIREGIKYGELSSGMFDITIGRLSRLWDIGGENYLPTLAEMAEAKETVDYRKIAIDGTTVQLENPGAWIDLGGIAKGFIADKVAGFLIENGVESALIDIGRNLVTIGSKPDGSPWRIGVKKPFGHDDEYVGVLEISGASVVSAGTYERQFEYEGISYHHILNPITGMPSESDVISATIISTESTIGEGLSTIAVLLGSKQIESIFKRVDGFIGAALVLGSGEVLTIGDVRFRE